MAPQITPLQFASHLDFTALQIISPHSKSRLRYDSQLLLPILDFAARHSTALRLSTSSHITTAQGAAGQSSTSHHSASYQASTIRISTSDHARSGQLGPYHHSTSFHRRSSQHKPPLDFTSHLHEAKTQQYSTSRLNSTGHVESLLDFRSQPWHINTRLQPLSPLIAPRQISTSFLLSPARDYPLLTFISRRLSRC